MTGNIEENNFKTMNRVSWTADALIRFENDLAKEFEAGRIKAPLHLAGGNEKELIEIFSRIKPHDYVLCSWRSHYHCLLKGVPAQRVKDACLNGRSIGLCFADYRILSSAIVGGICPIAVGLGWVIKRKAGRDKVYAFVGDMTAESGIFHESRKYAARNALPVRWIIEDNGLSVCTPTQVAWGTKASGITAQTYYYKLSKPHVGTGKWVSF